MFTLPFLSAFVLFGSASLASQELDVGQPAPDLGFAAWVEPGSDPGQITDSTYALTGEQARRKKGEERARVGAYHGVPLVIHTLAGGDAESKDEVLALMRDLVRANLDRGIAVIGVVDGAAGQPEDPRLPYPLALAELEKSESPYAVAAKSDAVQAFVVGPNGALLWHGDPLDDERKFLAAVQTAYARIVVSPIESTFQPELKKAVADYLAADLKDAASKAKKLARGRDPELSSGAQALTELVQATQNAWLGDAGQHGESGPDLRYFECVRAIRTALAKTDAIKELDALEKEVKKKKYWRLRAQDLNSWLELRAERPALFPARVTKSSDAFAKDLEKFKRSTWNSNEATRSADALLERYAQAKGTDD